VGMSGDGGLSRGGRRRRAPDRSWLLLPLLGLLPRSHHLQFLPPAGGLVGLAPIVVEPHQPLQGLRQAAVALRRRYLGLALLQAPVALPEPRLGLGVLPPPQQGAAEERAGAECGPVLGLLAVEDLRGLAQERLGLVERLAPQRVGPQRREHSGRGRRLRP